MISSPLVPTIVAMRPEQRTAPSTLSTTGVAAFTGSRTGGVCGVGVGGGGGEGATVV